MPRRRAFLASLGAGLSAATTGCATAARRDGLIDTPTDGEDGEPATAETGGETTGDDRNAAVPPGLGDAAVELYRETIPSVVGVLVYDRDGRAASGSGFVTGLGPGGPHVVTNQHVVAPGNRFRIRFQGNEWREATLVGTDVYSDLAVLRPRNRPDSADPLSFAPASPEVPVGTDVLAIGTPFDLSGSASAGIVSGVDRLLPAPNEFSIPDAVQTDAALNPGNSGGPLVDATGEVVAVVNSGGGENIGFGISAALSRRVVPRLIADGEFRHSYLGVGIRQVTPTAAEVYDLDDVAGLIVVSVVSSGPSDGALRGTTGSETRRGVEVVTGGDVIVGIGDATVETQADLSNFLALETSPGDTVPVTVVRDDRRVTVDVELGARPRPRGSVSGPRSGW
ncbi:S1C family serine protease [Halobaculum sp. MBLA0147]|uniref:S1C family serine protease n=1 Tax=Halobaculum sp. MBLA0147 TaxID=3079934 RepID=UPI003526BAFF